MAAGTTKLFTKESRARTYRGIALYQILRLSQGPTAMSLETWRSQARMPVTFVSKGTQSFRRAQVHFLNFDFADTLVDGGNQFWLKTGQCDMDSICAT